MVDNLERISDLITYLDGRRRETDCLMDPLSATERGKLVDEWGKVAELYGDRFRFAVAEIKKVLRWIPIGAYNDEIPTLIGHITRTQTKTGQPPTATALRGYVLSALADQRVMGTTQAGRFYTARRGLTGRH